GTTGRPRTPQNAPRERTGPPVAHRSDHPATENKAEGGKPMPFSEDEGRRAADAGAAGAGQAFTPRQRHCDFLELWRRCPGAACRRTHSCAGVPGACFNRAYAGMSEIARLWAAAGIVALDRGASRRAAALAADSRVLSHL